MKDTITTIKILLDGHNRREEITEGRSPESEDRTIENLPHLNYRLERKEERKAGRKEGRKEGREGKTEKL